MNFIKKNYSLVSMLGAFLVGLTIFGFSFWTSKAQLIDQTTKTIDVVTNVKWQLINRKLLTLEQQLELLSRKDNVYQLLAPVGAGKNGPPKPIAQFDAYVKGMMYDQGYTRLWLMSASGEVQYASNPEMPEVPSEIGRYAKQFADAQNPTLGSIVLGDQEPYPFYFCEWVKSTNGSILGMLSMEVPREFLSIELHNTISLDSLTSYLTSSQGTLNQFGKLALDTCVSCKWSDGKFIQFSPPRKIRETWSLVSLYPISQINVQHIAYASFLDGMIAFFVATGIVMVIIYGLQAFKKSKGITHADIMLVQTTWNAVSEYSIKIITSFYKYLFADAPEVKPMFKSAQSEQQQRMALMINTIVNSADSLEEFKGSISQLAKRHVHMGVKREYFPIVVKAIVSSVEEQYGKGFSPAHRKAWYKILNQVSTIMIEEMETYQRTLKNAPA